MYEQENTPNNTKLFNKLENHFDIHFDSDTRILKLNAKTAEAEFALENATAYFVSVLENYSLPSEALPSSPDNYQSRQIEIKVNYDEEPETIAKIAKEQLARILGNLENTVKWRKETDERWSLLAIFKDLTTQLQPYAQDYAEDDIEEWKSKRSNNESCKPKSYDYAADSLPLEKVNVLDFRGAVERAINAPDETRYGHQRSRFHKKLGSVLAELLDHNKYRLYTEACLPPASDSERAKNPEKYSLYPSDALIEGFLKEQTITGKDGVKKQRFSPENARY